MAMQPPQPPPNGGRAGLAARDAMARLGYMARWHCDRCGLGFDDFDACEAHEAGCDGTGGDAGAGAQDQDQGQGPPLPVVIPQDDDEEEDRPAPAAAAAAAAAPVPQRAPHQLPSQPPAPAIIPIHNDGDTIAGGPVSAAAGHHRQAAPPIAEAVAQPARAAREAEQDAIDLTIGDSDSNGDGSSDDEDGGGGGDNDNGDDDDDDVVVVDDAGAPPAVPAAAAPPPKRGVVTVWTCDVCGVAEFDSFEAAAAHEEACAAKKEREDAEAAAAAAAAARKAQQQREAAAAASKVAMAALPPPFQPPRLLQQGAQPQQQPQQPQQEPQQQPQQQQHPSNSNINPVFRQQDTKYWSCDICNASFQSYDAACKHERNCEGNPNAPVKSITTFRGVDGRPISDEASQLTEPVTLDDPAPPCWTCDHCQVAHFDTYDQASAHERICRAMAKQLSHNNGGTGATTNNANMAPAPKRSPPLAAAQLVRTIAANPGQQRTPPPLPQDASQMARSASDAAINARMKALRDESSSEKDISHGEKSRKRPSSSDVEDEERLGSTPAADTTKRSAKRQRNSKTASDEGDDSNTAQLVCMVDEDLDGHEYYVPPSGGVPLVSTQSASMFAQLSLYYQIIISNLELCHGINGDKGKKSALDLRCHNCKSNPEFNTFITLSDVTRHNWHKAVKQLAKHVEDCPCLASHTLQDIKSSRRHKKEKALAAYVSCDTASIYITPTAAV